MTVKEWIERAKAEYHLHTTSDGDISPDVPVELCDIFHYYGDALRLIEAQDAVIEAQKDYDMENPPRPDIIRRLIAAHVNLAKVTEELYL